MTTVGWSGVVDPDEGSGRGRWGKVLDGEGQVYLSGCSPADGPFEGVLCLVRRCGVDIGPRPGPKSWTLGGVFKCGLWVGVSGWF